MAYRILDETKKEDQDLITEFGNFLGIPLQNEPTDAFHAFLEYKTYEGWYEDPEAMTFDKIWKKLRPQGSDEVKKRWLHWWDIYEWDNRVSVSLHQYRNSILI